jgi:hypothetical protein
MSGLRDSGGLYRERRWKEVPVLGTWISDRRNHPRLSTLNGETLRRWEFEAMWEFWCCGKRGAGVIGVLGQTGRWGNRGRELGHWGLKVLGESGCCGNLKCWGGPLHGVPVRHSGLTCLSSIYNDLEVAEIDVSIKYKKELNGEIYPCLGLLNFSSTARNAEQIGSLFPLFDYGDTKNRIQRLDT